MKPISYGERILQQRRAQRFECSVQVVIAAIASGQEMSVVFPSREYAERVYAEAEKRVKMMTDEL